MAALFRVEDLWAAPTEQPGEAPRRVEVVVHDRLVRGALRVEDGFIAVPTAPGLGIDVDEALARANPYRGAGLHLQMQEAPVDIRGHDIFSGGAPR